MCCCCRGDVPVAGDVAGVTEEGAGVDEHDGAAPQAHHGGVQGEGRELEVKECGKEGRPKHATLFAYFGNGSHSKHL